MGERDKAEATPGAPLDPVPGDAGGEDAIYFVAAKNRYVGSVSLGYGPDGKRIRRKVFGKTKQEVRDRLKVLHQETNSGVRSSSNYTVRRTVDNWLREGLDGTSERIRTLYEGLPEPLLEMISTRQLRDLTAGDVRSALGKLVARYSTRSLQITRNSRTELVPEQMKLCLHTAGSSLDNVLKCTVYCTSAGIFAAVDTIYARYFPAGSRPGSSCECRRGLGTSTSRWTASPPYDSPPVRSRRQVARSRPPPKGMQDQGTGWAVSVTAPTPPSVARHIPVRGPNELAIALNARKHASQCI